MSESDEIVNYVFNFKNNEGFAFVIGDNRLDMPVIALTDNGYLNPEEGTDHPGLITFLYLAENYYENQIAEYEAEINGESYTRLSPLSNYEWIEDWQVAERFGKRTYLNWSQDSPFNDNVPLISGYTKHPPLGCTATATMLLMAWHKFPSTFQGHTYDWDEMLKHKNTLTNGNNANPDAYADLAKLSRVITWSEHLHMNFGMNGSGASIGKIQRTLTALGYSNGGKYVDWDRGIALNELREYPHTAVVVSAFASQTVHKIKILGATIFSYNTYDDGHTFLLEEIMTLTRRQQHKYGEKIRTYSKNLVYINYGWDGRYNGYYNAGVFDAKSGPIMTRTTGSENNYQFNIEMAYGMEI